MKTRRQVLKGAAAGAVVAIVPSVAIPGLAPVTTLERLAAEGKYISVMHDLPLDRHSRDYTFTLDGKRTPKGLFLYEIYAPGDSSGWAVVYIAVDSTGRELGFTRMGGVRRITKLVTCN